MNEEHVIAKNIGFLTLSNVINGLLNLVLFAIAARYVGTTGLGKYTFAISFTTLFGAITDLGLSTLAVRHVAKEPAQAEKYLGNIVLLKFFLALISFGLICLIISLMHYPPETTKVVYLIGGGASIASLSTGLRWYFQASQRLRYEAILQISYSVFVVFFGILALTFGFGVIGLGFAQLIGATLILLPLSWLLVRRLLHFSLYLDLSFWKSLIKRALPFALMSVFTTIYLNIDTVMLSIMRGDVVTGLYNVASRPIGAVQFLPPLFVTALFPVMSKAYAISKTDLLEILNKSFQFMLMLSLPIAVGTTLIAHKIIDTLYGTGFENAVPALQILIWAASLVFINGICGTALISAGKERLNTTFVGIGVIINIIVNLSLIPSLGHIGTSIGILVTELFVTASGILFVRRYIGFNPLNQIKASYPILMAVVTMGIVVYFLREQSLFISIPCACVIYFGIILLMRRDYLQFVKALLNMRSEKH